MVMASIQTFSVELMIRGYCKYKVVWYNPLVGENLLSERKVGDPHDMHAVQCHVARPLFLLFVGTGKLLPPHKKWSGLATL